MDTHDSHSSFIKTPQQLVAVVLLAFLVPIIGIVMVVSLVLSRPTAEPNAMTPEAVAARIQPVGRVEFGSALGRESTRFTTMTMPMMGTRKASSTTTMSCCGVLMKELCESWVSTLAGSDFCKGMNFS